MGLSGLEPPTSRLSGVRSNQLSYKPFYKSGSHLLSHAVPSIVPSAAYVLTFVFGMWTGVSHKRIATRSFYVFILFYKEVRFTKLVLRSSLVLVKFLRTKFALTSCFALARIRQVLYLKTQQ